jgi:hypothetical protein
MLSARRLLKLGVSGATLTTAILLAKPSHAQEGWLVDGEFGIAEGLEGGTPEGGSLGWRRARLRLVAGADLRTDESESEGYGLRAFVELEGRGTLGAEARYLRWATRSVGAYAGLTGTIVPETLFGGTAGARFIIPMGRAGLFLEPSLSVLPLGSDLPQNGPLIWALFSIGLRLGL